LTTGSFERDVKEPRLSIDDLYIMKDYLEEVMWEKIHIEKIEENWR
tara:strand:+ start:1272 stop:1409 length:138 start_codon:yes stop_codon:yes gene_type:complete